MDGKLVRFNGGGKRVRTADILHAMQARYQLSYTPTGSRHFALYRIKIKNASAFSKKIGRKYCAPWNYCCKKITSMPMFRWQFPILRLCE